MQVLLKIVGCTAINKSNCVAPLSLLLKDHKIVKEGELYKTRPVVSSMSGMQVHLNNILGEFVEPIADNIKGKIEVISGEDMLSRVDRLNKLVEIQEREGEVTNETAEIIDLSRAVLTGADSVGLYPSLKKLSTAKDVKDPKYDLKA